MKSWIQIKLFSQTSLFITAIFMFISFVVVTIIALGLYTKIKGQQRIISLKQTIDLASSYSNLIKNSIEKDLIITQTLANNISNFEEIPYSSRRSGFKAIHKITFLKNPQIYNLFTICERNSFDELDKEDQRFYYSTFRTDSLSFHVNEAIYYDPDSTWWFNIPKKSLADYISEPYYWFYPNEEDSVFEISIISPIISKGRFLGVVGIDRRLDILQNELSVIKPFGNGFVFLISNNGLLVSYPDDNAIGSNYISMLPDNQKITIEKCLNNGRLESFTYTNGDGQNYITTLFPVKFGNTDKFWAVGISIPDEVALKPVTQNLISIIIIGSAILFLIIFCTLVLWNYSLNIKVRVKTEEIETALSKAEEASNLKSAFLGNISHGIRTPLNGIMGFSELLATEELEASQKTEFNAIIQNNVHYLLKSIDDILDISKIESEQMEIHLNNKSIISLIKEIEKDFCQKTKIGSKETKINFSVKIDIPQERSYITTDFDRLKQALDNVLDNALKFTDSGNIDFIAQIKDQRLIFDISDTGKGIPRERLINIFDSFRQDSEDYMNSSGYGIGLGLSIARGIITLLKGDIQIESEVNKGTRVIIALSV